MKGVKNMLRIGIYPVIPFLFMTSLLLLLNAPAFPAENSLSKVIFHVK